MEPRRSAGLPERGGVLQAVGETFRPLGGLGRPPGRYLAGNAEQLSFDIGLDSTGGALHQGVEASDGEVEPGNGGEGVAPDPVGIEGDDLSHDHTLDLGSDMGSRSVLDQ